MAAKCRGTHRPRGVWDRDTAAPRSHYGSPIARPAVVLRALLSSTSTYLADVDPDPANAQRALVRGDHTGTMQLYELDADDELSQLTALGDPVGAAAYLPGTRKAVIASDRGGNERHQLSIIDLETARSNAPCREGDLDKLTDDPRFGHHLAGVSQDGALIAYVSNKRNGVDFDAWVYVVATREHRCVYDGGGWCQPATGFSPDSKYLSIHRPGPRPLDVDLLVVEVATGTVQVVMEHPDEAALVENPAWVDATTLFVSSNVGRDFAAIVRYDLETGALSTLEGTGVDADAQVVGGSGGTLLVIENDNGTSRLTIRDGEDHSGRTSVPFVEPGVVATPAVTLPSFSADGSALLYTLTTPRLPGDVWSFDLATAATSRRTRSASRVDAETLVTPTVDAVKSFDGEVVNMFVFRPLNPTAPPPVVVHVHGGPEGQAVRQFNPVIQGLVAAGYAVVVPNVRGSTGYGKRFAALDDTTKRLDSVADLAAVHGSLDAAGLDASRAALMGGSYGGYMVLAGLAFQPGLWAAGVDVVGISDLVTFLENTSDYRRAHREHEYGSLTTDREFLAAASPLRHADAIVAPLFVIHGRNDPRVPVSEAEQLVAILRDRDVRCELVVYEDEGHGLARLANKLDAYPRAVAFLDDVLTR
jgi:dipeptidyl aminopeptidase/acylaminoacyl peptidase